MPKQFRGSYSVTVTPFTPDGSAVDFPALERFLDWQIESGVPGVIILGKVGAAPASGDPHQRTNTYGYGYGMRLG